MKGRHQLPQIKRQLHRRYSYVNYYDNHEYYRKIKCGLNPFSEMLCETF